MTIIGTFLYVPLHLSSFFTDWCRKMPYPQLQQKAPFFKSQAAINGEFKEICLNDYRGQYLVLFFYPLDFTFVCPTEIVAFSDAAWKFRGINCEVRHG